MASNKFDVVTGAFGYSGKYITHRLLGLGHSIRTLTNSANRPNPFGAQVEAFPFNFDDLEKLTASLQGALPPNKPECVGWSTSASPIHRKTLPCHTSVAKPAWNAV
jgi:hypothetical protein